MMTTEVITTNGHEPWNKTNFLPTAKMVITDNMTDGNASFLRAARSGNVEKIIEYLKGNIDINTSNANGLNALHLAAKEGHVNLVTELLKRGANVNAATKKGNTALHIASLAGQEEIVRVLIQLGANVNVQSQNGFTPLYMAAQENHDSVVSFLLANGANQSLATEDGFTPLAVALQQGHDKVVAVLLENDTKGRVRLPALHIAAKKDDCKAATLLLQSDHNPDVTSKSGFTPLHIAAHYGNENIAKILLSKGADVNYAAKHQITPLHVASKWGKNNMVVLLLENGANIEAATRDGLTPLHCAARSGHDQVVDLLLQKDAPFLAKTKNGLAPLHMASQGDHVDSARILLYHKAPVDDVTVDYLTALHVAAHCGHVKVAKLLLDRKADPNARALNGFTPLHIACKKNRIKVVELLLKHGASIEATTESGLTPLHVASFMGCMNIVIYLIQNGSNPDVPTVRGETPLHLAARANQTDIIRILLRNGASVDARAREEQTPLHIASRLGNVDIVSLLLQHGAAVDATTKDMYTSLHIAAKEDQEEVASSLLDHGASLTATTKKGFTPLHLAAKYGNIKVARLLLQKGAAVDAQGKNGVTPLHVASHYDHVNVALLLLEKGASPHAMAKNGYTPLHIAAKKNQMDIASTLIEYGANANAESKAGFTPLHLAAQEGHVDMSALLIDHKAKVNHKANNGLTPLHLCAQDDRVNVAIILVDRGAEIGPQTKAGYTPLHVASHFGQINMVRFLIQNKADVHTTTSHGYTALHQAAQQGHTLVVNHLLEKEASPNVTTMQGQTPLSIAQRLGYISVVETLKVVTETTVTTTTTTVTEEKYKVVAPETMQETFMTDSEDEGGADFDEAAIFGKPTYATHVYLPFKEGEYFQMSEEAMLGDQSYRYLTADEMKSLGDDSLPIDVTKDEKHHDVMHSVKQFGAPMVEEDKLSPQHGTPVEGGFSEKFSPDNVDLGRVPVHAGRFSWADDYYSLSPKGMSRSRLKWKTFLVSFMVDARGGAMRGCRHSGVRVIIPPRKASMPMRITCRYLRKEKLIHPPPLMEGEACASRILEMGPVGARFLGPVIIEVPHFASTRGKEREITILRSDTGESWREHTLEASEEAVQEVLNESFEGEELSALEDLNTNRITRILTTDFPQYFAIVTRVRQEVHGVGPEGGMVSSTVVPQVQAIFPEGALTKKIRVGLQAQPIAPELVAKLLGNRVAVSPIVTVEPRRRKFHKPITLTIPVPQAATKGMINQYSGDAPTLRLLCSITGSTKSGGSSKAQWEDVTGSTPLTFVNDCVSFTTTVSARFWLMDCRQVNEVTRYATELYQEAVYVPFMSKFVIFAKRHEPYEAQLRVFCMTDDKEDKTLECQENFTEVAKSRDVEVLEGKPQYLEFAGNLTPVTKSGEQLKLSFQAFHENRLPFIIRVKDPHMEPMGRIAFMREPKTPRGEPPQVPICNLNVALPEIIVTDTTVHAIELVTLEKKYDFMQEAGLSKPEVIHRADLRLSDIAHELDKDWVLLAQQLDVSESDVSQISAAEECDESEKALMMLRLWLQKSGSKATGNELEKGLRKINREDIIKNCMFNVELVTDDVEKAVAKVHLDQSGFDVFKEELGSSREASMRRGASLDVSYDEQDIMKEAESAAETSSETGSLFDRDQISHMLSDDKDTHISEEISNLSTNEDASELFPKCKITKQPNEFSELEETVIKGNLSCDNEPIPVVSNSSVIAKEELLEDCHKPADETSRNIIDISLQEVPNDVKMHEFWPPDKVQSTQTIVITTNARDTPSLNSSYLSNSSEINCSKEHKIHVNSSINVDNTFTDNKMVVDEENSMNNSKVNSMNKHSMAESCGTEPHSLDLGYCSLDKEAVSVSKTPCSKECESNLSDCSTLLENVLLEQHFQLSPEELLTQPQNPSLKPQPIEDAAKDPIVKELDSLDPLISSSAVIMTSNKNDEPFVKEEIIKPLIVNDLASTNTHSDFPLDGNTCELQFENSANENISLQDARIRRASKTPPPSPVEEDKEIEVDEKAKKVPTTEIKEELQEIVGAQELPVKLTESETWPSLEMDTSQVSISSLPDDEKSEPTTATIPLDGDRTIEAEITEDFEDLDEETLSPTKFKDLCSKTVSPTKSIYEGKVIFPPKLPVSVQLTPEKLLGLQELPLSPVKEVSEIETKETCTSPCSDRLETMKPNQLISTRKGFRNRKRLSPVMDTNKFEPKLPSKVDRGLSPIAVFTAGPSGVEKEESEYFVQTYDAPSMQEPVMPEKFCNRSTEMSPNTLFGVKTMKASLEGHIINNIVESKSSMSMEFFQNYLHDKVETDSEPINQHPNSPVLESNSFDTAFADKLVETLLKVEKSTSPFSDLMLDTGIGTESPITADTASSPFFPDVQSPSNLLKESCSTQTLHVEMLSAHTSPIDGSFSLQDSNLSYCATESSLKSDSLDDISKTLGTPSSDYVELSVSRDLCDSQFDLMKSTVKDFLEERIADDSVSGSGKIEETEEFSTCSTHEQEDKDITDNNAINKILVIESFRNVFATEPSFSIVASPKTKRDIEKNKRRKLDAGENTIFSLHDQLLSEESALESSTDSGVDLKETGHGHSISGISDLTSMKTIVDEQNQDINDIIEVHSMSTKFSSNNQNALNQSININERLNSKENVWNNSKYRIENESDCNEFSNEKIVTPEKYDAELNVQQELDYFKNQTVTFTRPSDKSGTLLETSSNSPIDKLQEFTEGFIKNLEDEIICTSTVVANISPTAEIDNIYMQEIFPERIQTSVLDSSTAEYNYTDTSSIQVVEKPFVSVNADYSYEGPISTSRQIIDNISTCMPETINDDLSDTILTEVKMACTPDESNAHFQNIKNHKIVVAEATLIKNKDLPLSLSDQNLVSKLEQNSGTNIIGENTEADGTILTTQIIQKTTTMTLSSHEEPGDSKGAIQLSESLIHETERTDSPASPELSFAEKRDFFQKLSLSSSTATPSHTLKGTVEAESTIEIDGKLDTFVFEDSHTSDSPEEQLSFKERLEFFEKSSEPPVSKPEVKDIKKEVWTVISDTNEQRASDLTEDVDLEKEREIETMEFTERRKSTVSIDSQVSLPLYESKEVTETIFDSSKDAKVEVVVKTFVPGSEMLEICSVENIDYPESTSIVKNIEIKKEALQSDTLQDLKEEAGSSSGILDSELKIEENEQKMKDSMCLSKSNDDVKSLVSSLEEKILSDEEFISKTFKTMSESSYEASKATVDAFKKDSNDKENKWQRESPDNIQIVKESMEPSLGKSEIFICTEETLDNVKKILSVADAESNVVIHEVTTITTDDHSKSSTSEKDVFICTEGTASEVKKIMSQVEKEMLEFSTETSLPEIESKDEDLKPASFEEKIESKILFKQEKLPSEPTQITEIEFKKEIYGDQNIKTPLEKDDHVDQQIGSILPLTKISSEIPEKSLEICESIGEREEQIICKQLGTSGTNEITENKNIMEEKSSTPEFIKSVESEIQEFAASSSKESTTTTLTQTTSLKLELEKPCSDQVLQTKLIRFSDQVLEENLSDNSEIHEIGHVDDLDNSVHKSETGGEIPLQENLAQSVGSTEEKSDSCFSSLKDQSVEIEFLPVLEVSDDISNVAVDMTGHEALGTPCSFHKEMVFEDKHSDIEEHLELRNEVPTETQLEKISPTTSVPGTVEKAEYEEVEKTKQSSLEEIMSKESLHGERSGLETVESVEVMQIRDNATEVYNVSSEKLIEKFSSKKIHFQSSIESRDKIYPSHKLNQFLDSVTQQNEGSITLPSELAPVLKRTEEWIDQSGQLLMREGCMIDNENGLDEDRPTTLDDEHHKRSSPTAESFDDRARVEQCDTDVMMQLLDFVSRNEVELSEVRTEDEAPDIEEDVSPSAEDEICLRMSYDEQKIEENLKERDQKVEKVQDSLKVVETEVLLLSPQRSSFDSVTSPSKKDVPSDTVETVVESHLENQAIQDSLRKEKIYPQSSLEVEIGSHDSEEFLCYDIEKETVPLSFVEEEEHSKLEFDQKALYEKSISEAIRKDDSGINDFELAPAVIEDIKFDEGIEDINVKDPSEVASNTINMKELAEGSAVPISDESVPVSMDIQTKDIEAACEIKKSATDVIQEQQTDVIDLETHVQSLSVTGDKIVTESEPSKTPTDTKAEANTKEHAQDLQSASVQQKCERIDLDIESEIVPKSNVEAIQETESSFTPCAFVNTAFVGAEIIDEVEQCVPGRARSPYEVVREDHYQTSETVYHIGSQVEKVSDSTVRTSYVTRSGEVKRRPLLQHIPSEISEEDLVEKELSSPITKEYFEAFTHSKDKEESKVSTSEQVTYSFDSHDDNHQIASIEQIVKEGSENSDYAKIESTSHQIITAGQVTQDSSTVMSPGAATKFESVESETDTGVPMSPFEVISESELSDKETRTIPLSLTMPRSDEADKSPDSVIMSTLSQSLTDKTISADVISSRDISDGGTLNAFSFTHEEKPIEESSTKFPHSEKVGGSVCILNGPGEVEYQAEYDDENVPVPRNSDLKYTCEESGDSENVTHESTDVDYVKETQYGSVSDDIADEEIGEILRCEQQMDDIIERPVTPEPPVEEFSRSGFIDEFSEEKAPKPHLELFKSDDHKTDYLTSDNEGKEASPTATPEDTKSAFSYGMQFEKDILDVPEEAMDIDSDQFSDEKESVFAYSMRFEHDPDLEDDLPCYGDLYTHEEVDEESLENGEKSKFVQKSKKDSDFDILAGRKYFSKNVDLDEMSTSSLQEFERLEAEIVSGRKSSVGSVDSLNGKLAVSKSGEHDDVSMCSLTEFERLEKECLETEKIPQEMQESITQLSEIEEGHESQASETSQDNKSDTGKDEDLSIMDDYDNQLDNIEEIIMKDEPFQYLIKQPEKLSDSALDQSMQPHKTTETTKHSNLDVKVISAIDSNKISLKSTDCVSKGEKSEDIDQDSLREELSLKPDSLTEDPKQEYLDSLHEGKCDDVDSLQGDEMRDSLFEDRPLEEDSLHEMDMLPDESSLSLESSFAAAMSIDSSKADDQMKQIFPTIEEGFDSVKQESLGVKGKKFEIIVSELPRDVMLSSTDSLEHSSSAAAAAFHMESESAMSTSLTSALMSEDNTMISSTDTLEQEGRITFRYEDIPVDELEILVKDGRKVIVDSEGNIQTEYNVEHFLGSEDNVNDFNMDIKDKTGTRLPTTSNVQVHTAVTTMSYTSQPKELQHYKVYSATDEGEPEETYESFQTEPEVEIEEIHTTDEFGNPKTIRKMKKVIQTKTQFSSSSSSNNVEEKLKEFLREHAAGEAAGLGEEEVKEERTIDDKGNIVLVRTVQQKILTEPEVFSQTFTGPDADALSHEFVEKFRCLDPTDDVCEFEKVDDQGNVVRVTQQTVVKPEIHSVSFSGPNAHKQMEEYMKQWTSHNGDGSSSHFSSGIKVSRSSEQHQEHVPSGDSVKDNTSSTEFSKTLSSSSTPHSSEQVEIHTTTSSLSFSESDAQQPRDSGDPHAID